MWTSTAPVLPALSDYSLHPRHTRPTGPGTQSPTTQSWFAFHIEVFALVPSHLGSSHSMFVDAGLDLCAPRAHMAVMATPRTHCHFTMQVCALRVPELCDDHTPPSRFVANSLAEPRYRSLNTLVLPDPLLTQGGPVTFLACTLRSLFVSSCDLAHHGLYCSLVCACAHHSSLQRLLFRCLSSLSLRAHMDELRNMRLPLGSTGWNHSYYTGIPHSAPHTLQQPQAGGSSPPLCKHRSPHESHMVQRLKALCPAHKLYTVLPVHRFRRAHSHCHK